MRHTYRVRACVWVVDDALALLMLLHLPKEDVELLGITTTYGYTQVLECFDQTNSFCHRTHICGARAVVRVRCVCDVGSCVCGEQVRARVAQEIVTAYERGQSTRVPDEVGEVEKNESKSEKNEHEDDEAEAGEEAKEHQPKPPSDPPRIPVIAGHGVELGCVHECACGGGARACATQSELTRAIGLVVAGGASGPGRTETCGTRERRGWACSRSTRSIR